MQASPSYAYPIRARLGRAMHEVIRWAENTNQEPAINLAWLRAAQARAERIVQPSEPFDIRWQREWAAATDDLVTIRRALCNREH